jgi:hypothetical protein
MSGRQAPLAPESEVPEVCEVWCGRAEAPDGCICLGRLRSALGELDRLAAQSEEAATRLAEVRERLRRVLGGRFDPRSDWPVRRG